jgi:hypothetical protein
MREIPLFAVEIPLRQPKKQKTRLGGGFFAD